MWAKAPPLPSGGAFVACVRSVARAVVDVVLAQFHREPGRRHEIGVVM
jgi:hypothetical protein